MNLFDVLPTEFFRLLTGRNQAIYAKSLDLLLNALEHDQFKISKDQFSQTLKDAEIDWSRDFEYDSNDIPDNAPVTASKVAYIINRLEECGWIEFIIDPIDNREYIVLPDYTIFVLQALRKITNDVDNLSLSLVHSTYSELKLEDEQPDEFLYASLQRAYENTIKLRTDLVTLGHSIQIAANRLGSLFSTNEILHDHFDRFKERVANRYYHPYKTFDSITRFRRPIVGILNGWLNDREIRKLLVNQSLMFKREKNIKIAEENVIDMIITICDLYDQFAKMLDGIDEEYSKYTKSSVTKIIYLNNSDKSIKGHLETIFKFWARNAKQQDTSRLSRLLGEMQDSTHFYEQGFIDEESVTLPIIRLGRDDQDPLPLIDFADFSEGFLGDIAAKAKEHLTDDRIYEFMEQFFGDKECIFASDIPLLDTKHFLIYILAVARSVDPYCFYTIENVDTHDYIKLSRYYVPNFKFVRKTRGEE